MHSNKPYMHQHKTLGIKPKAIHIFFVPNGTVLSRHTACVTRCTLRCLQNIMLRLRPKSLIMSICTGRQVHTISSLQACKEWLPFLSKEETRTVVTLGRNKCRIHVEKGGVIYSTAEEGDRCNSCTEDIKGRPISYFEHEQPDTPYGPITGCLCQPCITSMFKQLKETQRRCPNA